MKIKVLIAAAALIFVIGIACSIFVLCSPSKSIVNIVRDGELAQFLRNAYRVPAQSPDH